MEKSPDAFRTISEVAESLDTPAHVLRFWESRFPQIRPVKRAGGRRYYRPSDVALLAGIKRLLHDEGMTIRGVQKILREHGIRHVARLGSGGEDVLDESETIEAQLSAALGMDDAELLPMAEAETAQIIALEAVLNRGQIAPQTRHGDGVADAGSAPTDLTGSDEAEDAVVHPSGLTDVATDAPTADRAPALTSPDVASPTPDSGIATDSAEDDQSPMSAGQDGVSTIAARLRALPQGALAHRSDVVAALQDRILTLRARLAETSRRRRR